MSEKITAADEVCQSLAKRETEFASALPPQIPSQRFIRVAQTAIRVSPKLLECDRATLYSAFFKCAQDGLLPDGREAAIVPWGKDARYMPMIAGIMKKARNSGEIKSIGAQVVYEKDAFESWEDELGPHFKFKKAVGDRGRAILTYAYAITKDGGVYFEEIDESSMSRIMAMSKASDSPWKGSFQDEMKKKSALRRLLKHRVPSSTDLDQIIRADDDMYEKPKEESRPAESTSSRLRDAIETTEAPAHIGAEDLGGDLPI